MVPSSVIDFVDLIDFTAEFNEDLVKVTGVASVLLAITPSKIEETGAVWSI